MLRQLFYTGPSLERLHRDYAMAGRIDPDAPIQARAQIEIDAPVEQVWQHLVDLPRWPTYSPAFRDVRLHADVSAGAEFRFTLYNFPIRARLAVVEPGHQLVWTGKSLWFKAVDRHELEAISEGRTRYAMAESFSGVLATLFMSAEQLQKQHRQWQTAFKQAVERGTA